MTTVQQWGRRESIIWPPRGFYYTYGAIFLAILATGFLIYVHFKFALSSLQQHYLPYYLGTETASLTHPTSMYRLVYVTDGKSRSRIALDADVRPGETPQLLGRPLPFVLSAEALAQGFRYLAREPLHPYPNKELHTWIAHWIYADTSPRGIFATPLYCGILALILQLPLSIRKDIRRRKELRYGRRLPVARRGGCICHVGSNEILDELRRTLLEKLCRSTEQIDQLLAELNQHFADARVDAALRLSLHGSPRWPVLPVGLFDSMQRKETFTGHAI